MTVHGLLAARLGFACLCGALAIPAAAVGLGELQVHSSLGEPLDATVDLAVAPGATLRPDCFSLARPREGGLPSVSRATSALEPDGAGRR